MPLDHSLRPISIKGITDPKGDRFDVVMTGVTHDEPVSGSDQADRSPDAIGIGDSTVWLRAEATPTGDGRAYTVSFQAVDEFGNASSGTVNVTVPAPAPFARDVIDDGRKRDATTADARRAGSVDSPARKLV